MNSCNYSKNTADELIRYAANEARDGKHSEVTKYKLLEVISRAPADYNPFIYKIKYI